MRPKSVFRHMSGSSRRKARRFQTLGRRRLCSRFRLTYFWTAGYQSPARHPINKDVVLTIAVDCWVNLSHTIPIYGGYNVLVSSFSCIGMGRCFQYTLDVVGYKCWLNDGHQQLRRILCRLQRLLKVKAEGFGRDLPPQSLGGVVYDSSSNQATMHNSSKPMTVVDPPIRGCLAGREHSDYQTKILTLFQLSCWSWSSRVRHKDPHGTLRCSPAFGSRLDGRVASNPCHLEILERGRSGTDGRGWIYPLPSHIFCTVAAATLLTADKDGEVLDGRWRSTCSWPRNTSSFDKLLVFAGTAMSLRVADVPGQRYPDLCQHPWALVGPRRCCCLTRVVETLRARARGLFRRGLPPARHGATLSDLVTIELWASQPLARQCGNWHMCRPSACDKKGQGSMYCAKADF